jgi:TorA maturation chaperone TorD
MGRNAAVRHEVAAALSRAAICRALARGLDYPSAEARFETRSRWRELLASDAGWPSDVRAALTAALEDLEREGSALEPEHVRLFGPAGRTPPVETAWADAGRLLGKAAALADLGGFYRAFGVQPGTVQPRPEDHLAVELEFLSVLAVKEAWAIAEGLAEPLAVTRDAARLFLADHLGTWVDAWREALAGEQAPTTYVQLAEAVTRLVRAECARLRVEPRPVGQRAGRVESAEPFACPLAEAT